MNKKLLLFSAACFFTLQSISQYGSSWAGYPVGYEVSSGFATKYVPGNFWLGYLPQVQNINTLWHVNKNFCIMGSGSSSIWAAYKVFESGECSGSLTQVLNGNGITAIETSGANNLRYALAGVYDKACYFTTLDSWGNVLSTMSYPFPKLPSGLFPAPSKPVIVESDHAGDYYICGSFEAQMYVINVNSTGNINWSSFYSITNNANPKDIMMSPYYPGELIVIGETNASTSDVQGFFMRLDSAGNIINTKLYGSVDGMDGFGSITKGAYIDPSNAEGFVVGGYTQLLDGTNGPTAWALKLDPKGNIIWSNLLTPSTGQNTGIIDLVERKNKYGDYEYYTLLNSNVGMQVLKLNNKGNPFTVSPVNLHNEFIYDLPAQNSSKATSISYVENQAFSNNPGIQVFGTATNFPGFSSSYVVNAYFNGETSCYRTLKVIRSVEAGPEKTYELEIKKMGSFTSCPNFQVVAYFPGGSVNYPCLGLSLLGNNQRTMPSGTELKEEANENFSVYPNPVINKAQINYSVADNDEAKIDVYNLIGQHILTVNPQPKLAGTYQEEIDFASLNVESGVYFVTTAVNGNVHKQKIVYSK